jgi:hypothetical protein
MGSLHGVKKILIGKFYFMRISNPKSPIILFTYNRPLQVKLVLESLQRSYYSKKSDLFIYSDGAKNNDEDIKKVLLVRNYLKKINGFKKITIIERNKNYGLSKNIISGVTSVLKKYSKVIVLEDDILVNKNFLKYMNDSLLLYRSHKNVASIHGYSYPIKLPSYFSDYYFIKGADCWGWATWRRAWKKFDANGSRLYNKIKNRKLTNEFNFSNSYNFLKMLKNQVLGKNNSWAIRWYASVFLENMLTLYPKNSFVKNIGFDINSTHRNNFFYYNSKFRFNYIKPTIQKNEENLMVKKKICNFFLKQKYLRIFKFLEHKFSAFINFFLK